MSPEKIKASVEQKSNVVLWIKGLLGGEFRQGRGMLKTERRQHCCLGVFCEVHPKIESVRIHRALAPIKYGFRLEGVPHTATKNLNIPQKKLIGLTNGFENELIAMNDSRGKDRKNFTEIANTIRLRYGIRLDRFTKKEQAKLRAV